MKNSYGHLLGIAGAFMIGVFLGGIFSFESLREWFGADATETDSHPIVAQGSPVASQVNDSHDPLNKDEIVTRLNAAAEQPSYFQQMRGIYDLIENVSVEQLPILLKQMEGLHASIKGSYERALISKWVELDPPSALNYIMMSESDSSKQWTTLLFETWVERDEVAALASLSEVDIQDEDKKGRAQSAIVFYLAKSDLQKAVELTSQFVKEGTGLWLYQDIMHHWAKKDPLAAVKKAEEIIPGEDDWNKGEALRMVLNSWGEYDRSAALDWLKTGLQKEEVRNLGNNLFRNFLNTWAEEEPKVALEWVRKNTKGAHLNQMLPTVVSIWVKKEPEKAMQFVAELEAGPAKNKMLGRAFFILVISRL